MTTTPPPTRKPIFEIDLVNNNGLLAPANQASVEIKASLTKINFSDELKAKFYETIDAFWHTEEDQLELFCYFSDGTWYAQRKRQKYDFASESLYWNDYTFKGGTAEQAAAVYNVGRAIFAVESVQKATLTKKKLDTLEEQHSFFEAKWLKRITEKRKILQASDWRVLPDVADAYEGEKDEWIAWRQKIRSIDIPDPNVFDTPLDFMKTSYQNTFPLDPKNYRKLYPNGLDEDGNAAPAFMDPNDEKQWTSYDDDASSDFFNSRMINKLIYARQRVVAPRIVEKDIKQIIKDMRIEEIFPEFDIEMFQVEDE